MRTGARPPKSAGVSTGKELAERALRRLLRGGTIEALAREMAGAAVRSTGADPSCLDWLADALEVRLADHVNRLDERERFRQTFRQAVLRRAVSSTSRR